MNKQNKQTSIANTLNVESTLSDLVTSALRYDDTMIHQFMVDHDLYARTVDLAIERVRNIVNRHGMARDVISMVQCPEDYAMIVLCILHHDTFAVKYSEFGNRLPKEFIVCPNLQYGAGYQLCDKQTGRHIKWKDCAKMMSMYHRNDDVYKLIPDEKELIYRAQCALRNAIRSQCMDYLMAHRDSDGGWSSEHPDELGVRLYQHGDNTSQRVAVDHYGVPFCALMDDWIDMQGGLYALNMYHDDDAEFDSGWRLDGEQLVSWQQYHREHANLRLVSAAMNDRMGARSM